MKIELIIFDNDGVLIDSEIIWHQVCAAELSRIGYPTSIGKSLKLFSSINHEKPIKEILEMEFGVSDINLDLNGIGKQTEASYTSNLKPVENIHQILDFLDKLKIKKCIASNADFDYIQRTMQITGLDMYFNQALMFGVQPPMKRKPEPDVFLKAAEAFSVQPEQCLVIEDHALGIKAAKAANMKTIGFLGASHAKHQEYHDWIAGAEPLMIVRDANELMVTLKKALEFM